MHRHSLRSRESAVRPVEREETRVRNPHLFGESGVTHLFLGFVIALVVGLTGIGGGSFTVPALLLLVGLPAADAVGTAFVFAGVLRLVAAPFYLLGRQVHGRYFRLLIMGAVPGLVLGIIALRMLAKEGNSSVVVIILGALLAVTAGVTFLPRIHNPRFAGNNSRWLPWLAFPIGVESGFSSAGAGALGTVLLLNYSEMTPTQVVGTDILFGLVLAIIGSAVHWSFGSISTTILLQLLAGGVPGVVLGCLLARRVPAQKLKAVVAAVALAAGLQLVWSGAHAFAAARHATAAKLNATASRVARP